MTNPRIVIGETRDPGLKIIVTNLFRSNLFVLEADLVSNELGKVLEYIFRGRIETTKPQLILVYTSSELDNKKIKELQQ